MHAHGKSAGSSKSSAVNGGNAWKRDWPNPKVNNHSSNDFLDPLVTKLRSEMESRFSHLETLIKESLQISQTLPKEGYPRWGPGASPHPKWFY